MRQDLAIKGKAYPADQLIDGDASMKTNLSSVSDQNQTGPPLPFPAVTDPLTIDKSLEVKGEVIGSESLYLGWTNS
jgi:hypothetical protein